LAQVAQLGMNVFAWHEPLGHPKMARGEIGLARADPFLGCLGDLVCGRCTLARAHGSVLLAVYLILALAFYFLP
jgi:hypothetical protein